MTVPDTVRVFVDARPVDVARGATALDAVAALDPAAAAAVADGQRAITDSRGLPADPATVVVAGAIFRLVRRRDGSAADGSTTGA